MKERLTYGIFFLFMLYAFADLAAKAGVLGADLRAGIQLLPELTEGIKCVFVCWFGREVYQVAMSWIDRKHAKKLLDLATGQGAADIAVLEVKDTVVDDVAVVDVTTTGDVIDVR